MTIPADVRRRQRQFARWVRAAPGYRLVVREILPQVRHNAVLNDLVSRVFASGTHRAGQAQVPFRGGIHLTGSDVPLLPVVGLVMLGADREQLVNLMDQLADVQRRTRGFRPLLLVDTPAFAEARRHGYVIDLLVPREAWTGDDQTWEDYVARRLVSTVDDFQLWSLLRVSPGGLSALDVAILEQLAVRLPKDRSVDAVDAGTDRLPPIPRLSRG